MSDAVERWSSGLRLGTLLIGFAACGSPAISRSDAAVQSSPDAAVDLPRDGVAADLPPEATTVDAADVAPEAATTDATDVPPDAAPDVAREAAVDDDGPDRPETVVCCPVGTPSCEYDVGGTASKFGVCPRVADAFPVTYEIRKDTNGCDMIVPIGPELHLCNLAPEAVDASSSDAAIADH